jgi:Heavy metal binding domain
MKFNHICLLAFSFVVAVSVAMLLAGCGGSSDQNGSGDQGPNDTGTGTEGQNAGSEGNDAGSEGGDSNGAHVASFFCTMKCEGDKTYPEPGDCPVCGMSLVETPKEGADNEGN